VSASNQPLRHARFGAYEVNLHTHELWKHGRKLRLAGRPFQVLAMLLENPGELVTREEMQSKLWPADTFVDFEHGVNSAIRTLRVALCDSHAKPRYIETLPRRGYRFIAALETSEATAPHAKARAAAHSAPLSEWAGQIAVIHDETGSNYALLPLDESMLEELHRCHAAKDDLGISLLCADEKLLLVPCGTKVKILDAPDPAQGFRVRILGGQFIGKKAFAPRKSLLLSEKGRSASA
jgi:DNA-binding winged helix-turn-helix (wHTH) protein